MARNTKRQKAVIAEVDMQKAHAPAEAISLIKKFAVSKFDETVEIHFRLGINVKHADQQVRTSTILPAGTGKTVRVAVVCKGDKQKEAETAGADVVGSEELVPRIQEGWMEFDVLIATPDVMGALGKVGKILGPRGLMPSPKAGTVTFDVAKAVKEFKAGKVEFRADKQGICHIPVGRASFSPEQLAQNVGSIIDAINKAKPAAAKGTDIKTVYLSSTMGPGLKIDVSKLGDLVSAAG
jgi:large subunit ribosomal protein L1